MKKILAIIASLALAGAVYAGCGKKITSVGKLDAIDAKKKTLAITPASKDKKGLRLTKKTKITGADGKIAKIEDLKGQQITVISEHGKVDSVAIVVKKKG